ncbi:pimeloyl-ACP methyl ester carboxylesterase [Salsuginibacillus halophilus]|uniref:Pimeloyl-ACP methyl ester carboxylesterase n=1 Tax=Salsuginibacillus halophilus TaxID=517424 RepID=A0A2P8H3N0_9BACI|nr:alpha/beta hydrolase [Salsuginibacillus halophilus]PSL40826.1 pimeloyl-ACP methyl ester carboxylesterase [Salsuginibacillus halophilus]
MFIDIDGVRIHYHRSGEGQDVVLLHGWGANIQAFAPVHNNLENHFTVWSIDFPGFGESEEPPEPWTVGDYTELIRKLFVELGIEQPVLVGHSFGGRVSIKYAAAYKTKKVILVDSAGVKPKRKPSYYVKVYSYKALKRGLNLPFLRRYRDDILMKVKGRVGSSDYQQASGVMQQTMVKVVNEDLQHHMPHIHVPTLLVWGENDEATPVSDGQVMEKAIPDAGLVVLKNAGHYAYLDQLQQFLRILDHFLQDEKEEGAANG